MSVLQKIAAAALLMLLASVGYGLWSTHRSESGSASSARGVASADALPAFDQATLRTAQTLAALATSAEERVIAQQTVQAADHELDIAFAAALRRVEAHPPVLSEAAQKIQVRLLRSQKLLETDQASVAQLTAALALPAAQTSGAQRSLLQDQLDLAKSQLELDQDEVEEGNQDLVEAGGNLHQRIQLMMQQHADAEKTHPALPAAADPLASLRGLARRLRHWFSLRDRQRSVDEARALAAASIVGLTADRQAMTVRLESNKGSVPELAQHARRARAGDDPGAAPEAPTVPSAPTTQPNAAVSRGGLLSTTRQIASDQKLLTLLDERIADRRDLVEAYGRWGTLLATKERAVAHAAFIDLAVVIAILLVLLCVDRWLERLFGRTKLDRRQIGTLRIVTRVGLQILGIVIILLVLVGMPGQVGTMLGIVGAGLTVALKDFIVAFIGWLVLMGKNGMRLGDWVEINGVSGEVVDLGMFHTVLLETGNWTEAGHPTGRRVTFTNSFAIQGHYFNFSTSGQWLWDEVLVLVPYERDPHTIAEAIHREVLEATAQTAQEAEQEWRRSARTQRDANFSAAPGMAIRPAVGGVEVAIRYVTRASDRFKLRTRLYQTAVQLLGRGSPVAPVPAAAPVATLSPAP